MKEIESDIYAGPLVGYELDELAALTDYPPAMHSEIGDRRKVLSRLADLEVTLAILKRKTRSLKVFSQSGTIWEVHTQSSTIAEQTTGTITHMEMSENIGDVVGDEQKTSVTGSSSFSTQGQSEVLTIDRYFQRPVKISTSTLTEAFTSSWIRVWDLYTLVPSVRAKLRNYAYLRGDLHVRVAISGTPFHYGRLLLSYQPYDLCNENISSYITMLGIDSGFRPNWFTYLSQAPGAVTIDVKSNKPVEMVCPFISTKPMHRLYNSSAAAIGAATSYDDLYDAGALYIEVISSLGSVAASYTNMTMTVYAWLENVELGTLTGTNVAITTESGKVDEREKGPIEKISSQALAMVNPLIKVPYISKYAKASQIVLKGINSMSALYGWSKPVYDTDIVRVKNDGFQNGANTIGKDTNMKITLDPHQELTVDPRVCGSDEDEMSFQHICEREAYLISFDWNAADVPFTTTLFRAAVSPCTVHQHTSNAVTYYQPTPLGQLSSFFHFWRGDIEYRFDFVCSSFHRGKVMIYYEPNIEQNVLIDANFTLEKHFVKIVDLQETQSICFRVRWAAPRPWLHTDYGTVAASQPWGQGITLPTNPDVYNGYFRIIPFTELVSPDGSAVHVNVYVRGHDMHFAAPTDQWLPNYRRIRTASGFISSEPISTLDLNETTAKTDMITTEYFGEEVISLRALMRRYVNILIATYTGTTGSPPLGQQMIIPNIPQLRIPYSGSPSSATVQNIFHVLRYMYLGMRGGVKYRAYPQFLGQAGSTSWASVVRVNNLSIGSSNSSSTSSPALTSVWSGLQGTVQFKPSSNAGIEYEIPFYTSNAFIFSFNSDPYPAQLAGGDMSETWSRLHSINWTDPLANSAVTITFDFALGEDFTMLRFQGCPYYSTA